jgi:stage II sporulation protein D
MLTVDDETFVRGTVATEMSPEAPQEALKAQAVAARTYYGRLRENHRRSPGSANSADFTVDTANRNIYMTVDDMKKHWGGKYDQYYKSICSACDAVSGQVLRSGGKLIDATYFAISGGSTEDAADVWGSKCPYLVSVASPWDAFAGGYQTSASFSADDFKAKILKTAPKADLSGAAQSWVGASDRSPAGTVKNIKIGGQVLTGSQVRTAFGLRSADFTVTFKNGSFTFDVKGYGHGVGLSQVGAEAMAREGAGYKQILSWYYPNTTLTK